MTRFDSRHRGRVLGLDVMHRDGGLLLASCGQDGTVRLWRGVEGRPASPPMTGHAGWVRAVRLVPARGRTMVVSGGDDGHVRRWDAATGDPVGDPVAPGGGLLTLAVVHADP
ncbi:MAG TPA: hypothetical protein VHN80_22205, partial [Kineosporiaceae bacterium]|nr:hypothetical protein [Kineosporiaceae bacterium]